MGDYNTDQRGDVGSKCRLAAMNGLVGLATITTTGYEGTDSEYFSVELCSKIIGLLLKQFSEKLNFVREEAAKCLLALLNDNNPVKMYINNRTALIDALSPSGIDNTKSINYGDASITYPMVMKAAEIDRYFGCVIKGLVLSTGGLTKAITQNSSQVLIKWVRSANDNKLERLGNGESRKNYDMIRIILLKLFLTTNFSILVFSFSRAISKAPTRIASGTSSVENY